MMRVISVFRISDSGAFGLVLAAMVIVVCLMAGFMGCGPSDQSTLSVGMELSYPPFEMTDEDGAPVGISVEMATALGRSLGREVEIKNFPFDGLIPALKTGKIDLIISSMTATPERAKSIDFSAPYLRTGLCLLISKDSTIRSYEDLDSKGRVIAVKMGTTGHTYATSTIRSAKIIVLDKEDACVLEVVQGKADAFIYDQMSTFKNWRRNPETTRALLEPFREETWAIGVRKGNEDLVKRVNEFLAEFRAGGGFERLGDLFLKEQKEAFQQLGYPFYF